MKKPTPIQAHLLRLLADNMAFGAAVLLPLRKNLNTRLDNVRVGQKPRAILPATIRALVKLGYLEYVRTDISTYKQRPRYEVYQISGVGKDTLAQLTDEDFIFQPSKKSAMTEDQVTEALQGKFGDENDGWVFFPQLRTSTGYSHQQQYMDGYALNLWPSRKIIAVAFEIKVYRSDFLKELKNPQKREFALQVANEFCFVTPPGLVSVDEVPKECGLIEVHGDLIEGYTLKTLKKAEHRTIVNPPWWFVTSIARRTHRQELSE